jgi:hypothetical protein
MTPALGLASRLSISRAWITSAWLMPSQVPSSRQR